MSVALLFEAKFVWDARGFGDQPAYALLCRGEHGCPPLFCYGEVLPIFFSDFSAKFC